MNEHDVLLQELLSLHEQNQPDADFANQLEAKLRDMYRQRKLNRRSLLNRSWLAAGVILLFILSISAFFPSVQGLAQDILDYFVPDNRQTIPLDETEPFQIGLRYQQVESLTDAQAITHFDFLVLPLSGNLQIDQIYADPDAVLLIYRGDAPTVDYIEPFISLRQLYLPDGLRYPIHIPFATEPADEINIRNTRGMYAVAPWALQTPLSPAGSRFQMMGAEAHRVVWQENDIVIILTIADTLADTLGDVLDIADQFEFIQGVAKR